jgi:hypothetical protein
MVLLYPIQKEMATPRATILLGVYQLTLEHIQASTSIRSQIPRSTKVAARATSMVEMGEAWNWRVGRVLAVIVVSFMVKKSIIKCNKVQRQYQPSEVGHQ